MGKIYNGVRVALQSVSAVFFVATIAVLVINVLGRIIFNRPLSAAYELVALCVVTFGSAAIVICAMQEGHVRVDVITERLKGLPKLTLAYLSYLIDILYYAVFCYCLYAYGYTKILSGEVSDTLKIPVAPFRIWMAVCITLIALVKLYQALKEKKKHDAAENQERLSREQKVAMELEAEAEELDIELK